VFGAYTHAAWPQRPPLSAPSVVVADPSMQSFLFSIVNAQEHPFVVPLIDGARVFTISSVDSTAFGASDVDVADSDPGVHLFCTAYHTLQPYHILL
jgi:hypothetical protein